MYIYAYVCTMYRNIIIIICDETETKCKLKPKTVLGSFRPLSRNVVVHVSNAVLRFVTYSHVLVLF